METAVKLNPIEVSPVGTEVNTAFVDGRDKNGRPFGRIQPVETPVYPASPNGEKLRATRLNIPWTLRRAAAALDLNPVDLSGLEQGRLTLPDDEWRALLDYLERLAAPKPAVAHYRPHSSGGF